MGTIDSLKSVLTQSALDALCEKFYIPDVVHPQLSGRNERIHNSPTGKIGVYSRFFDFANYQIPLSYILVNVLAYFRINLSQLSVITAAKVSHFEILCRVHGFEPTVGNFRRFYTNSKNKGWMSFSKRSENAQVCYTKPLDSLKNWNGHFFWVDASILPLAIPWHINKTLKKDPPSLPTEYNADVCDYLATNLDPFKKFQEPFLCFLGISRYYTLDEEMDLFAFIQHADPTKVRIGESKVREGEVPLLELTRGRVISLAGVNDQGGADVQGADDDNVNQGSDDAAAADHAEQSGPVVQIGEIDIEVDTETQSLVADKSKKARKRKTADGASGSGLPPKRLREDHGTSGDANASTTGKSLAALQDLLDKSTLATEIGVTAAATVPFVTSSVTPTPEHEGGGHADSVSTTNLRTKRPAERFLISSDTPHDSSANAADDKVFSVVRSIVPDPVVLTTTIATTVVAGTSVLFPRGGDEPALASIFADSTSAGTVGPDVAGPSQPANTDPTTDSFYVSMDMDSETLHQTYVPKWDLLTEFNVGAARQTCLGAEVRMRLEHVLKWKKRLEEKCGMQANLLKERDAEIVDLKARLSLREAEAAEAIRLRGQIANVEVVKATQAGELESLKERNVALEGRVTALKSAVIAKDSEVAKLTQELSSLQLSCDDLSIKASTLKCEKDKLVDQVSKLEATCFDLRDEVDGYKLFKEQVEDVQDGQVKALSDHVASIDSDLIDMALHMDEEFYPCYLTTIAGRRWILGRGLKLAVIKCLQSPEYLSALGGALGRAINKGMQDGLAAGVDHGRAGRGLDDIAAYDPSAEANFVSAVNSLCAVNFPFLAQLESQKDASMADIIDLLHLEGHAAETPKASQLQPSPEQLMVPIHRLEDQVIIGETSLSFSLDVDHVSAQRIRGDITARRLSLTDVMVPLLEPLSAKSLTASIVPPAPSAEVPPSPKIVFEQEELDTTPEHASAPLIFQFIILHHMSTPLSLCWHCQFQAWHYLLSFAYVSENGVSPLLDLIMVRCAHRTCGSSSVQSLLLSSSRAFIPSPKLLFALSTKPLALWQT
ncbi:hypothetical protein Tco_0864494 [Tanacetum coccineum]